MTAPAPKRFKTVRLWLMIGLGLIPFTGLPLPVQVGLAVGNVVLMMILSAIARNPGTRPAPTRPDDGMTGALAVGTIAAEGPAHAMGHDGHSHDHGGGAAASGASDGGGGDGGGGD